MLRVNMENNPNETPCGSSRDTSEANNEVFNNTESTLKKRKMDGRVKCPRLSSFNMSALRLSSSNSETSALRLSSSNSETSKGGNEGSSFNIDEELETLRCSPMFKSESPVFERKKSCCYSYTLTPRKPCIVKSVSHGSTSSDNEPSYCKENEQRNEAVQITSTSNLGVQEPLHISDSTNDSNISANEVSGNLDIVMQDPINMKEETVCTPHGLICPTAQCPQRPSKIRKSDATFGAERSCRLLFTKSEDAMKDTVASYGCDGGNCVSQTSEKPITPTEFGIELKKGSLNFDSHSSVSKTTELEIPKEFKKDLLQENMGREKSTTQNEFGNELQKETLNPNIQALGFNNTKPVTSSEYEKETITPVNNEKDLNRFLNLHTNPHIPAMPEKDQIVSENQNIDIDKSDKDKLSSPKSTNFLNHEILKNDGKNVMGLSTPILNVEVDNFPQSLATPTHGQNPSKFNNWISVPSVAPPMSGDKYLGNFASFGVKVLLTPTDSPINSPGSGSSCSCSCTECDFSPPSAAKAKIMSQTIESSNDMDNETQMPNVVEVIMDPIIVENNKSQIHENVESSNKSTVQISARNESLTSTPKDLTPLSARSNMTAISGVSPLPSSTPRPKHKHKHTHEHHHHRHHHHRHQQSMHHLTVHSNSHHHMTSDGDILITSTPLNRQHSVEELVKEEISAVGSDIDSVNADIYGKPSRFVMSDLCGSDQSANHYSLNNDMLIGGPILSDESKNAQIGGGAIYITGKIGSGSLEVMDNKETTNNSEDNCKLHLGTDESPEVWMVNESVILPRRASSVDETLFRVISQESPVCLSLN